MTAIRAFKSARDPQRTTDSGDPVPLAWSGDGRRLVVGGSRYLPGRAPAEFPPVVVLDAMRPCLPMVTQLPASNPRTRSFAQQVWVSADGATVRVCTDVGTPTPRGPFPAEFALQVFSEMGGRFGEARDVILPQDPEHAFWCDGIVPRPDTLFVQASDGLFAFAEREGRYTQLARQPDLGSSPDGTVFDAALAASSDGTRLAASVLLPWIPPDGRAEPVPVDLLSFSVGSGFTRLASFDSDAQGWPPRGWRVDIAMSSAGDTLVARAEPRDDGPTRLAVLRSSPAGGDYEVSPVPPRNVSTRLRQRA